MATEIERKFLVTGDGWKESADAGTRMRQGYLCIDDERAVRVRLAGDSAKLTIKSAGEGITRSEYEYEIPERDAREMLDSLCVGTPITKTRYRVRDGGHDWEVDVFDGANAGLVLAEVELDREDESVDVPGWVGREVSDDERYYNAYLARHPFDSWTS
jgi:adenylate cyclase